MSTLALPAPTISSKACAVGPAGGDGCRACVDTCPYGAIDVRQRPEGAEVRIDPHLCQRCGACSGVCPTSAIERSFLPAEELLATVLDATDDAPVVVITCAASADASVAATGSAATVVVPSLLIIDETILTAAIAAGAQGVVLLGCPRCTHDDPQILMDALTVTRTIVDDPRRVAYVHDDGSSRFDDTVHRMQQLARTPVTLDASGRTAVVAAADRRARLAALLPGFGDDDIAPVVATGYGHVTLDEDACVACGACAITCPTDTLAFDPTAARLEVTDLGCVGCGACVAACPDDALTLHPGVPIGAGAMATRTLLVDDAVACSACGEAYAAQRLLDHARATLVAADLDPDDPRFQLGICPTCRATDPRPAGHDTAAGADTCGHDAVAPAAGLDRRRFLKATAATAAVGALLPIIGRSTPAIAAEEAPVIVPGRLGMVIDLDRCIGCHACSNVCKAENNVPLGKYRDWVEEHVLGEYPSAQPVFLPKLCNHCDDPGCLRSCPTGAIFKRDDGIVDLDPEICIACQACMQGCPYGMTFYNHQRHTADKCNLCAHRIDEGLNPACVDICPSQCRIVGDFDDPDSPVSRYLEDRPATAIREDYGLGPNIQYVGLPGELNR